MDIPYSPVLLTSFARCGRCVLILFSALITQIVFASTGFRKILEKSTKSPKCLWYFSNLAPFLGYPIAIYRIAKHERSLLTVIDLKAGLEGLIEIVRRKEVITGADLECLESSYWESNS